MSIIVIAVATESGVPIFYRKRGTTENVQFSTIASLHGINMFSKCHNLTMLSTQVDNGNILWKEYCKGITLIGIATGGLECDLELLLSFVYDTMIFCTSKKELETFKNVEQLKRDLRQCYGIIDFLLESLDPNVSNQPTLVLDLIQSILCPQAQQLQQGLDNYAESVTGRWACLSIHGHLVATSSDFQELDPREARLLLLLAATQDGAPLRDTPVYLPQMSPDVAFRAVTCKLLADVYILVICGSTPTLSQIDEIVLKCWEGYAHLIKEAKQMYPRNFPSSLTFDATVLGMMLGLPRYCSASGTFTMARVDGFAACMRKKAASLLSRVRGSTNTILAPIAINLMDILAININKRRCVFSRHLHAPAQKGGMSGAHKMDILRTFYVTSARDLAPELKSCGDKDDEFSCMTEAYWSSEYHKCHAQRSGNIMCCALYASLVPTHTMRFITTQILQDLTTNKEIYW